MRCLDWATRMRDEGVYVMSGFQSPLEKEVLNILLKGASPLISSLRGGCGTNGTFPRSSASRLPWGGFSSSRPSRSPSAASTPVPPPNATATSSTTPTASSSVRSIQTARWQTSFRYPRIYINARVAENRGAVDKCAEECYSVGTFVNHEIAFSSCSRLGLTGWYDYIP